MRAVFRSWISWTWLRRRWAIEWRGAHWRAYARCHARAVVLAGAGGATALPPLLAQMARVGEETGNLEANLEAVADLYEQGDRPFHQRTDRGARAGVTIIMGLIVGFIAISTIMPIYSIMRQIR